jgi:Zn-dependent protease with chaperone function
MNFFHQQLETRKLSRRLVLLFAIAVVAVVVAVDAVIFTVIASTHRDSEGFALPGIAWMSANLNTVVFTTLTVLAVIGFSSLYKSSVLSGGGGVVARSVGGTRVSADTTDAQERRLLNVVEEISIASGVPMPEVYLLEQEAGINAFAAGHNPANAAIAVTRGALTKLNRAELQGVIAHEFSHVLNGDMRLNVRLMGLLFGLLVIAILARTVLRFAPNSSGRSRGKGSGGVVVILLAAMAVMIVGYVGLFFGRLIQAAVSRSRESLADASAVQFTRDPHGLRNALVKVGAAGSKIEAAQGEELAHMFFAPGLARFFDTHPPLIERLKAIDPQFDPREIDEVRARLAQADIAAQAPEAEARTPAEKLGSLLSIPAAPAAMAQLVGNPGTEHMEVARTIRESLPEPLVIAGRHPQTARAVLLALALDTNPEARERQLAFIGAQLGPPVQMMTGKAAGLVDPLAPEQRMPVLMHAFTALRQLTRADREQLITVLNGMLQREGRMSLHAYVLRKLAQVHLRDDLDPREKRGNLLLVGVQQELQVLFSVIAQQGNADEATARRAYDEGMQHVLPRGRPSYAVADNWPAMLDLALSRLDQLAPVPKQQLVEALEKTVIYDRKLAIEEAELLRAVCAAVHCPLPPLIA